MNIVKTQAPCRIDLFGGTLDLWPLYLWFQPCATGNAAISVMTRTEVHHQPSGQSIVLKQKIDGKDLTCTTQFPLNPKEFREPWVLPLHALNVMAGADRGSFTIQLESEAPLGSGLAASSSLLICLLWALNRGLGRGFTREQIQRIARDIETQVLRKPAGEQDYFPALFGGIGALSLNVGSLSHNQFSKVQSFFADELLLFYTGRPHHSGLTNWEIYQKVVTGDQKLHAAFSQIAENSIVGVQALQSGDLSALRMAISTDWRLRKENFPGLVTPEIQACEKYLVQEGISTFKVCGAAAGGCMFAFVEKGKRKRVLDGLNSLKMQIVPAQLNPVGVEIL